MKIYTGSDHAGFALRRKIMERLRARGAEVVDLGTASAERTDYPDYAAAVARAVRDDAGSLGVLVCGSGQGMGMAANKVRGVRAAVVWNAEAARLSRQHNDANVLCLGERLVPEADALAAVDAFLDTAFEGGRHAARLKKIAALEAAEGGAHPHVAAAAAVDAELRRLHHAEAEQRLWEGDPRLFTADASHDKSIRSRLGWLTSPGLMAGKVGELRAFADEVRGAGFTHAVLLGMGGSSLCPEVMASTLGAAKDGLPLVVLDNTDPAAVADVERRVDLDHTLFIVASKSGGTIEIKSFERHFWAKVAARHGGDDARTGQHFVAITDPGTALAQQAADKKYRRAFVNPADIGGRYSAVSYFGLVPAALLGADVAALVDSAERMAMLCGPAVRARENPGVRLGAWMGALAREGRDKLTLVTSPGLASLGSWIEQLVAESTGKLGKGIVPVDLEPLGAVGAYDADRLFAYVRLRGDAGAPDDAMDALEAAGQPVLRLDLARKTDIGGEFFRWEIATAIAGASLELNPFDEPNVTEAKTATAGLLGEHARTGRLPAIDPSWLCRPDDGDTVRRHLASAGAGDYVALCAYLVRSDARDRTLARIRAAVRDRTHRATTLGYGPRFLHSTGQLHKGGANNGVFLQITADAPADLPVPGEAYTFATLRDAQALGDLQVLKRRGRRVLRVHLGGDVDGGLDQLARAVEEALA